MGILTAGKIEATFSRLFMKNEKLAHSFAVIRTSKTDFDISIEATTNGVNYISWILLWKKAAKPFVYPFLEIIKNLKSGIILLKILMIVWNPGQG